MTFSKEFDRPEDEKKPEGWKELPHRTMTVEEWRARGKELYGDNMRDWEWRCVACGHVQSGGKFKGAEPSRLNGIINFSCEGRYNPEVGCDWTLGGLFTLHTLTVIAQGKEVPSFEFAKDPLRRWPFHRPREGIEKVPLPVGGGWWNAAAG